MKTFNLIQKNFAVLACVAMGAITTGCGSGGTSSMLTGITLASNTDASGNIFIDASIHLDTGNLQLVNVNLPVVNPAHPTQVYGTVALVSDLNGTGSELTVSVNASQFIHLGNLGSACSSQLPNGTAIPVGGLDNATVICLPIGNTGGRVYLGVGSSIGVLGAVLPFKQLDGLGQYVPGVDIFQPFTVNKVTGTVGIFTGSQTGQTGLGVFANVSGLIPAGIIPHAMHARAMSASDEASTLSFPVVQPSRRKLNKAYSALYWMNVQGGQLELQ